MGVGVEDTGVGLGTWEPWEPWDLGGATREHGHGRVGGGRGGPRLDPARIDFFGIPRVLYQLSHSQSPTSPTLLSRAQVWFQGQGTWPGHGSHPHKVQSRYMSIPLAARHPAKYRPRSHLANDGTSQPASNHLLGPSTLVSSCLASPALVPYHSCRIARRLLGLDRLQHVLCIHLLPP